MALLTSTRKHYLNKGYFKRSIMRSGFPRLWLYLSLRLQCFESQLKFVHQTFQRRRTCGQCLTWALCHRKLSTLRYLPKMILYMPTIRYPSSRATLTYTAFAARTPSHCTALSAHWDDTKAMAFIYNFTQQNYWRRHILIWLDHWQLHFKVFKEHLDGMRWSLALCRIHNSVFNPISTNLIKRETTWCGRLICHQGIKLDPTNLYRLLDMPQPKTAGDLKQFYCTINWLRAGIPFLLKSLLFCWIYWINSRLSLEPRNSN